MTDRIRRWRATERDLFHPAVVESRDLHLAILALFAERDLTDPALNLEQLLTQLPSVAPDLALEEERIKRSLAQLVNWGHLDESRDESAVYRTPEEFQRRNLQWSLTGAGSAAIAGLDRAADFLCAVTSLQTATIDALAQCVARAAELASRADADPVEIHMEWHMAETYLGGLAENVRQLQRRLSELMRDRSLDDAVLARARDVIIEYVNQFIHDAEEPANRVRRALGRLHELGPALVFERALVGANLAPDPLRGDPSAGWLEERHRHLSALDEWFVRGADGGAPRMERLRQQGRDWVLGFLRALDLRRKHHRLSAGIVEDFTALARAFASCEREDDAHRLAVAAFALHGARHHDLAIDDVVGADPSVSAAQNPGVPITLQLRAQKEGKTTSRERPVRDARKERARRAREQVAKLAELDRLREELLTDGSVRLSSFAQLEYDQYRELLDLLCAALTTPPGRDGTRACASGDGRVMVRITDDRPRERTRLETIAGTLDIPDYRVSIRLRDASVTAAEGRLKLGGTA